MPHTRLLPTPVDSTTTPSPSASDRPQGEQSARERSLLTRVADAIVAARLDEAERELAYFMAGHGAGANASGSASGEGAPAASAHPSEWPRKTRELRHRFFDSRIWNEFRFRPDDVVIATYAKAGTTWTQQIVGQLVLDGRPDIDVATLSPWVDFRVPPKEEKLAAIEAQEHRRFLKTHLPLDALVFSPQAKYIYIGRDGRDIVWSFYNHHASTDETWYQDLNALPGDDPPITPPPASIRRYFLDWLNGDGYPFWSLWDNVASWWPARRLPNVLFLHYADLKADLPREVRRIARFLGIELDAATFDAVIRHSSFAHMKVYAELYAPQGGRHFKGGAKAFIHKGVNGRWREVLTAEDCRLYEETAERRLGAACAHWLAHGGPIDDAAVSGGAS